jgi:hypothetical protein
MLSDFAVEELSRIFRNRFPSLPLSLSSPYLPPSLPYRAGVVGGVNNVDIYMYTYIYYI